jgi:hypothetical protein
MNRTTVRRALVMLRVAVETGNAPLTFEQVDALEAMAREHYNLTAALELAEFALSGTREDDDHTLQVIREALAKGED